MGRVARQEEPPAPVPVGEPVLERDPRRPRDSLSRARSPASSTSCCSSRPGPPDPVRPGGGVAPARRVRQQTPGRPLAEGEEEQQPAGARRRRGRRRGSRSRRARRRRARPPGRRSRRPADAGRARTVLSAPSQPTTEPPGRWSPGPPASQHRDPAAGRRHRARPPRCPAPPGSRGRRGRRTSTVSTSIWRRKRQVREGGVRAATGPRGRPAPRAPQVQATRGATRRRGQQLVGHPQRAEHLQRPRMHDHRPGRAERLRPPLDDADAGAVVVRLQCRAPARSARHRRRGRPRGSVMPRRPAATSSRRRRRDGSARCGASSSSRRSPGSTR